MSTIQYYFVFMQSSPISHVLIGPSDENRIHAQWTTVSQSGTHDNNLRESSGYSWPIPLMIVCYQRGVPQPDGIINAT